MNLFRKPVLLLVAAAIGVSSASATIIFTDPATDSFSNLPTNFTRTLVLPKFDPSLGTLVSVELVFNESATYSLQFVNTSTVSSPAVASFSGISGVTALKIGVQMQVKGPNVDNGVTVNQLSQLTGIAAAKNVGGNNTTITLPNPGNASAVFTNGSAPVTNSDDIFIDPLAFSFWTASPGSANISLATTGTNAFIGTASGTFQINGTAHASGDVSVTYGYTAATATPEPATVGLFGGGLLAMACVLRRRRQALQ